MKAFYRTRCRSINSTPTLSNLITIGHGVNVTVCGWTTSLATFRVGCKKTANEMPLPTNTKSFADQRERIANWQHQLVGLKAKEWLLGVGEKHMQTSYPVTRLVGLVGLSF